MFKYILPLMAFFNKEKPEKKKHFSSRKLLMALLVLFLSSAIYLLNVYLVYIKPEAGPNLVALFNTIMVLLGSAFAVWTGAHTFTDAKYVSSDASTNYSAQQSKSYEYSERVEKEFAEKFKNDDSYAPIEWIKK